MSDIATELPSTWTAWRSAVVLMLYSAWLSKSTRRDLNLERIWWELEKYGPTFCGFSQQPASATTDAEQLGNWEEFYRGMFQDPAIKNRHKEGAALTIAEQDRALPDDGRGDVETARQEMEGAHDPNRANVLQ